MKFGLICEFRNPEQWKRPIANVYEEIFEYVSAAEEMGFEAVEVLEHHFVEDGYIPSPLVAMSALAARTEKMRLASNVALLPLYEPVRFAEDTAVLDAISNGRLDVGVSIGYRLPEFAGYRISTRTRAGRINEAVQIVRRLWSGESVTFEGKYYQLKDVKLAPLPVQKPTPPLWIGGFAKASLERAAKYGDGYTAVYGGDASKETYENYKVELQAAEKIPRRRASGYVRRASSSCLTILKRHSTSWRHMHDIGLILTPHFSRDRASAYGPSSKTMTTSAP